jgi:flagellar export protein FliJ
VDGDLKARVTRLQRLLDVREALSRAAEAGVRESEQQVDRLDAVRRGLETELHNVRTETVQTRRLSGNRLRIIEQFIQALERRNASAQYNLEKAHHQLERRRHEWVEALRDQRIAERSLKRKSRDLRRATDTLEQKSMDDAFNSKIVRTRRDGQS